MSSVAPESTTAGLAGQVPREQERSAIPGAFLETPAHEAEGFSINPLPATGTGGNPVSLAPGAKVPDHRNLTAHTLSSNVTTDKESYEKGNNVFHPKESAFTAPPVEKGKGLIPESSLPIGGSAVNTGSAGPFTTGLSANATTAGLAGQVPLEPKAVPDLVKESQREAHVDPEASANTEAVLEKKEFESELKSKVPEAPAASESGLTPKNVAATVTGAAAAAGAAVAGAAYAAKDKATNVAIDTKTIASGTTSGTQEKSLGQSTETAPGVPEVVTKSFKEAHTSPEAAANPEAVVEKKEVEAELAKKIHTTNATGESAPTAAVATTETARGVPDVVTESYKEAHTSPEAAANAEAVTEKKQVEAELAKKVHTTNQTGESAPTATAATTETAPAPTNSLPTTFASPPTTTSTFTPAPPFLSTPATTTGPASTTGTTAPTSTDTAGPSTPHKETLDKPVDSPDATSSSAKKSKRKSVMMKFKKFLK